MMRPQVDRSWCSQVFDMNVQGVDGRDGRRGVGGDGHVLSEDGCAGGARSIRRGRSGKACSSLLKDLSRKEKKCNV